MEKLLGCIFWVIGVELFLGNKEAVAENSKEALVVPMELEVPIDDDVTGAGFPKENIETADVD